ncbi:MAG: T9SS type A sorting domain-containing protein [Bacteroidota bacterium]|nr:T9SS type A sorting domain-containing protein [Bacteroidota bacterium]
MKKLLLPLVFVACMLMPRVSTSQTYSSFGMAVNNNNNLFDTVAISGNSDTLPFRFVNAPDYAWNTATVVLYYQGNFGPGANSLQLFDENNNYGNNTPGQVNCGPEDSTVITYTSVDINNWNANDTIDFTVLVNGLQGPCLSTVRVKLTYEYCASPTGPAQFASVSLMGNYACALGGNVYSLIGTPSGGTFSGPGVTGSTFDPASFNVGTYQVSYTFTDSIGCMTTGTTGVFVAPGPTVNSDSTIYACYNTAATLNATIGNGFIWYTDLALTQALDTTDIFTTPSLTQTTTYYVAGQDFSESFSADTLFDSDSLTVDVNNLAGDDRGGMAIDHNYVYLNGDDYAVRYDLDLNAASGVQLPIRDGMVSDLRTGAIWTLWNDSTSSDPNNAPNQFTVTALRGLDSNLAVTSDMLVLSQSIDMGTDNEQCGIFAGFGYVGLYSGNTEHWYVIDMDNGFVTDLGFNSNPGFYGSENWSDWGVLQADCNGNFSAIYRGNNTSAQDIEILALPDAGTTSLAVFANLGDMASLVFSPDSARWYFHYEGSTSTFGGSSETLGYADAAFSEASCGASTMGCPSMVTVNVPSDVAFNFPSATVCLNDGAQVLSQGTPSGGTYTGFGVGTSPMGTVFFPALAGNGTYTLTYTYTDSASGCVDFATDVVTVDPCTVVEEQALANGISVYPNPNNGSFTVAINATAADILIEVMDLQGRVVFSSQENNVTPGFTKQINIGNVSSGMYMMKISSGNQLEVQKITIQR